VGEASGDEVGLATRAAAPRRSECSGDFVDARRQLSPERLAERGKLSIERGIARRQSSATMRRI